MFTLNEPAGTLLRSRLARIFVGALPSLADFVWTFTVASPVALATSLSDVSSGPAAQLGITIALFSWPSMIFWWVLVGSSTHVPSVISL